MKVNMTPNPLDVVTIHASQGDTEAREWEFELHNNGELIDTSEITEQMVFKAYKGGTEQILPENGVVPVTAPFVGDIKYPDATRNDQEFLYRQSPTEKDGNAKITDIKGNTIVWNQIQPNNISRTNNGVTYTYDNGKLTVSGTATATSYWLYGGLPTMGMKANHKYLFMFGKGMEGASLTTFNWYLPNSGQIFYADGIININSDTDQYIQLQVMQDYTINTVLYPQVFDLTQMFGAGNEPTTVEEFKSLFPLSYYSYNQGSLLSFNGNGIKTVGKNLINYLDVIGIGGRNGTESLYGNYTSISGDELIINLSYASNGGIFKGIQHFEMKQGEYVTISGNVVLNGTTTLVVGIGNYNGGGTNNINTEVTPTDGRFSITLDAKSDYPITGIFLQPTSSNSSMVIRNLMVERGSVVSNYAPYTSSLLNLPISTYFPTGMKSAGTVYDELTPIKAITRIGAVDLGSLTWTGWEDNGSYIFYASITDKKVGRTNPCVCALYEYNRNVSVWTDLKDKQITGNPSNSSVYIRNSSYTDVTAFKTAMSGVYLYYELATPTETPITTASLVTENAEIPLSNNDGTLIGKCTEQLSENPGFIDAKIKLADADGVCYSNKIQLHVERSPQ